MGTNYLSSERYTKQVGGVAPAVIQVGVDGEASKIWEGAMVALLSSGYAVRAGTSSTGPVQGVAQANADNSTSGASDGDVSVNLLQGAFWFPNSSDDPVAITALGKVVYAYDDQTICATSGGSTKPIAGVLIGFDSSLGCLVYISAALNRYYSDADLESNLADTTSGKGASMVGIYDVGTFTASATVEAALAEIYQHLKSAAAVKEVSLCGAMLAAGTPMAAFSDNAGASAPGCTLVNSKAAGIRWNNYATQTAVFAMPFTMPADIDTSANASIKVVASKVGATVGDATTFDVALYNNAVSALHDADTNYGGTTGAMTGNATSKTVQEVSLTLTAADLGLAGAPVTLSIKPTDGTLGTDDVVVHSVRLVYKRKLATS